MEDVGYRPAVVGDVPFLATMLGEAAVWRPDKPTPTGDDVMADPRYAMYLTGWPRTGDFGLVAEQEANPARRLYESATFLPVEKHGTSWTMLRHADPVTVTLTPDQWQLIRESLDARYQGELHAPAPWVATRGRRARDRADSQLLVGDLCSIDIAIATAAGLEPDPYVRNSSRSDSASVALGLEQWRVVQSALDTQYYDDDHGAVGGLSRQRRQERRDHRRDRLAMLVEIDRTVAYSTGLEAMLS